MRRLAPILVRPPLRSHPLRAALPAGAAARAVAMPADDGEGLARDLRLFVTVWLGGLVFFGTFLA
jgi:hypothetical protein